MSGQHGDDRSSANGAVGNGGGNGRHAASRQGAEGIDVRHDAQAAPDHDAVPRGLTGGASPGPAAGAGDEGFGSGGFGGRFGGFGSGGGGGRRKRRGGGRGGEQLMVPEAEFTSYYGRPILHKPKWETLDIAGYLFLGGLAGSSSVLAAGATATGRPALARACKVGSLVAISGSVVALVHDLGRPERFTNMLRTIKPSSPMSIGSWILSAYGPAAGVAAVTGVTGWFPRIGRLATFAAAATGPAVAAYTAPLIADTAVPTWHAGHRELPFLFVSSGATAAGGLGMLAAPVSQAGPARRAALVGGLTEVAITRYMERRMGLPGETLRQGKAGTLMRAAEALSVGGALVGGIGGRWSRAAAVVGGLAAMAGSACTRFGIFEAGVASTQDPKYVVQPQRERLERRASSSGSSSGDAQGRADEWAA